MSSLSKRGMLGLALVIPSFLILLVVVIIPILYAVKESLIDQYGTGYGLANYIRLFTEPAMRRNIMYTISVTLVSTALTLVISYALAIYLRFGKGVVVKWIGRLYFIPMFVPGVIATYAIITMYGNHGWAARLCCRLELKRSRGLFMTTRVWCWLICGSTFRSQPCCSARHLPAFQTLSSKVPEMLEPARCSCLVALFYPFPIKRCGLR